MDPGARAQNHYKQSVGGRFFMRFCAQGRVCDSFATNPEQTPLLPRVGLSREHKHTNTRVRPLSAPDTDGKSGTDRLVLIHSGCKLIRNCRCEQQTNQHTTFKHETSLSYFHSSPVDYGFRHDLAALEDPAVQQQHRQDFFNSAPCQKTNRTCARGLNPILDFQAA